MTLLLSPAGLVDRGEIARGPLAPLASSLAADLEPLLDREVFFPREKALLSRDGGRCAHDGAYLEFDPFQPHEHRCPTCGTSYQGPLHDRFWIYWYQLWLAERAVHAAVLASLGVDGRFEQLAAAVLDGYADRYASYPNVDNVLGPTRLFFSTYLESIWLLQICVATDLLDTRLPKLTARIREKIIEPSRAIVAGFDEGASNRQVWNDVALLAAARLLDDRPAAERAVYGSSGIAAHLSGGLLPDGTWYEGENYHLFAHRGLWYGVTMAERAGLDLDEKLRSRFQRGFAAPFATALPDFTLPSRRDSQYAISLRQWRIAEHCELGFAREPSEVLLAALQRMYDGRGERHDTGRSRSSADVERNRPASALTRADLSWRGLLFAEPELPKTDVSLSRSVLLAGQGIAVFRRDGGRIYAALDYGQSGGGHGHPDRLNLLLMDHETRWLDDFGTGSYVDPSLHWYRSTLAHNAPLVDGRSQARVDGELARYAEDGWTIAVAEIAPGVGVHRSILVGETYVVDVVEWEADREVSFDLPIHADLSIQQGSGPSQRISMPGGEGTEDGFRFLRDTTVEEASELVRASGHRDGRTLELFAHTTGRADWWRCVAPGPPGHGDQAFRVIRSRATRGRYALVWSLRGGVADAEFGDVLRLRMSDGAVRIIRGGRDAGQGTRPGRHPEPFAATAPQDRLREGPAKLDVSALAVPARIELSEPHYRRSEQSWADAGSPRATVAIEHHAGEWIVAIEVAPSDRTFVPADETNSFDNEPADINGDGVQLYLRSADDSGAWMLVPEAGTNAVRVRPIEGWPGLRDIAATWTATAMGYSLRVTIPVPAPAIAIDVVINEMPRGRFRRRGQLVLSGARGEFVYLRGDRHDRERLVLFSLPNA